MLISELVPALGIDETGESSGRGGGECRNPSEMVLLGVSNKVEDNTEACWIEWLSENAVYFLSVVFALANYVSFCKKQNKRQIRTLKYGRC